MVFFLTRYLYEMFNEVGRGQGLALALYRCINDHNHNIVGLVTTINSSTNRVSMHGVALDVLKYQADAIGIPLHVITLPEM